MPALVAAHRRTAVVSGGIGGLGTAICIALARAGCKVIAADLGGNGGRIDAFRDETGGLGIDFAAACREVMIVDRHGISRTPKARRP